MAYFREEISNVVGNQSSPGSEDTLDSQTLAVSLIIRSWLGPKPPNMKTKQRRTWPDDSK